jgi:hypothetical protein
VNNQSDDSQALANTRKALILPIYLPQSFTLATTGQQITDLEQIYIFKSLSNLVILTQKNSPNHEIAKPYFKQISYSINSNHNVLKTHVWTDDKKLLHTFTCPNP